MIEQYTQTVTQYFAMMENELLIDFNNYLLENGISIKSVREEHHKPSQDDQLLFAYLGDKVMTYINSEVQMIRQCKMVRKGDMLFPEIDVTYHGRYYKWRVANGKN